MSTTEVVQPIVSDTSADTKMGDAKDESEVESNIEDKTKVEVSEDNKASDDGEEADTGEPNKKETKEEEDNADEDDDDDIEGIDSKSRALNQLLKTSSVFVAIMADKMKQQQKENAEAARRAAAKQKKADEEKARGTQSGPTRKSIRTQASNVAENEEGQGDQLEPKDEPVDENGTKDQEGDIKPTEAKRSRGRPVTKQAETQPEQDSKKATASSKKGRKGRPVGKGEITDYLNKSAMAEAEDGPTVQEALAEAAEEFESKGEGLGEQDLVATEQPKLVSGGKMREYQLEGLEWLKTLWMNGLCGILADEMGLGKTVQAISMIAFFKENNISGPFLIAAPLSTLRNWVEEFKFWTPEINTVLYHGSKDERAALRRSKMKMQSQGKWEFPVVITSYEICMNDKAHLGSYKWRYIVVDEGHRLKNMNCKLIKELMTYNSANRLLITGTPLQNNIAELWSLLHFLLPEVFNDLDSFGRWFDFSSVLDEKEDATSGDRKAKKQKNNLVSTMHAILKPFLLRRIKTDVESSLPPKREYILYAPLTTEQRDIYREILAGSARSYLEEKAVERIEARSRTASLKRKANDSGRSTPAKKSLKATRDSTPMSDRGTPASTDGAVTRRGRRGVRKNYNEIGDREFNSKLRELEKGNSEVDINGNDNEASSAPADSSDEAELERSKTLKVAKQEIASKKLQNPVMQARLACNSPHNFYWPWQPTAEEPEGVEVDESLITASGKLLLLDELLPRLFKLKHKVLIFSQFKTTLDILETYATWLRGWKTCRIDGSIAQEDRYEQITSFNTDPTFRLFLLSTRAGGQGINLTAADTVVLFDSDWNPQQDLQAMDRAHRIGQTRPVIVYRLATRGTVEETLLLKADSKRKLEKLVIQKGKFRSLIDGVDAKSGKPSNSGRGNTNAKAGGDTGGGRRRRRGGEDVSAQDLKDVLITDDAPAARAINGGAHNDDDDENEEEKAEFEKYDVSHMTADKDGKLLTERELEILTDRSPQAYQRAAEGIDVGGGERDMFRVAETKRDGVGGNSVLEDLTVRKKRD